MQRKGIRWLKIKAKIRIRRRRKRRKIRSKLISMLFNFTQKRPQGKRETLGASFLFIRYNK